MQNYISIALGVIIAALIFAGLVSGKLSVKETQNQTDAKIVQELNDKF